MCSYCNDKNAFNRGELFKLAQNIDGGKQYFEVCIFDSPEDECKVLEIDGVFTDLRIEIDYCPMCGRKL